MINLKNKLIPTPPYFFYKRSRQENFNSCYSSIKNLLNYCFGKNNCHSEGKARKNPAGLLRSLSFAHNDAFTLAETLITLVIVGVVAALTVPNMIIKHQKEETVTRLKKAYSTLAQAYVKSQSEHGTSFHMEFDSEDVDAKENAFKEYFLKYLQISKYCPRTNMADCFPEKEYALNNSEYFNISENENRYTYVLNDGSCIISWLEHDHIQFYVDLNCKKGPNKMGRDLFNILLITELSETHLFTRTGMYFPKYLTGGTLNFDANREELLSDNYYYNCNKSKAGNNCGALIQMDGWQIKDDYPW